MHSSQAVALDVMCSRCSALGVPLAPAALQQQLRFGLWQVDHANVVTALAQRGSRQLKVCVCGGGGQAAQGVCGKGAGRVEGGMCLCEQRGGRGVRWWCVSM